MDALKMENHSMKQGIKHLEQTIEQLRKANERFIKANIEAAHMSADYLIEIERLVEERTWLIHDYAMVLGADNKDTLSANEEKIFERMATSIIGKD